MKYTAATPLMHDRQQVLHAVHLVDVGVAHQASAASIRMPMPAPK